MFQLSGNFIGDPWFYIDDDLAHMWFLTMPADMGFENRWHHWDIGHAVSSDLIHWDYRGLALERGWGDAWDSQKLATGSVIKHEGRYWMAYTGHRKQWLNIQRVGMAWSDDLESWHKCEENPVHEATLPWYHLGERDPQSRLHCSWRDPYFVKEGEWWYHLITAEGIDGNNRNDGVIGRSRSKDLIHWENVAPMEVDPMGEMECPQIIEADGRWYLVFSVAGPMVGDTLIAQNNGELPRAGGYSLVADNMWGPYRLHGDGRIQHPSTEPHLYAGQVLRWQGELVMLGFSFGQNGPSECIHDPITLVATPEGLKQQ